MCGAVKRGGRPAGPAGPDPHEPTDFMPGYFEAAVALCNDDDPSVHPGEPEICGNQIDDNCNGLADEGCPATTTGP
jgi:hypothetical protein